MKRLIAMFIAMGALVSINASPSFAVFTQKKIVTSIKAGTKTIGTPAADFTLNLKPISNLTGPDATAITWTNADPAVGFMVADVVIKLSNWVANDVLGGIQIYTDNTSGVGTPADPRFADPTSGSSTNIDSNPAGLLLVDGINATVGQTVSMAWNIQDNPVPGLAAADPNITPAGFNWLFMLDRKTPAIDRDGNGSVTPGVGSPKDTSAFGGGLVVPVTPTADTYATMIRNNTLHNGGGPSDFFVRDADKTSYVYLEADWGQAGVGADYNTSTLTVEAYIN